MFSGLDLFPLEPMGRFKPYKKSPMSKATKKRRAKNKAARKSRKVNRR